MGTSNQPVFTLKSCSILPKKNWHLEYIPCEWSDCLQQLEDGTIDLMPDVAWTEDRAKRFSLNHEDVLYSFSRLYASAVDDFTSIFDMDGKRIGVVKDSFQARQLRLAAKSYAIEPTLVEADNFTTVFELLSNNKVDGIIVNHFAGEQYKAKYKAVATGLVLFPSRLHFATAQGKQAELLACIDKQLLQLKKDQGSIYCRSLAKCFQPETSQTGGQASTCIDR